MNNIFGLLKIFTEKGYFAWIILDHFILFTFGVFFFLDKKSHIHYIFKVDLELPILRPPPLKYWDYRSVFTFQSKHIDSYNPKQFQEMFL